MRNKKNIALILSGGSGKRFEKNLPKQFAEVYGKSILDYCISNFNKHKKIHKILIVSNSKYIDLTRQIANPSKFEKVIGVVEGGTKRGESAFKGLKYLKTQIELKNVNVLIHDAVRPNINEGLIDSIVNELKSVKAVSIVIPATDTIYITGKENRLSSIPDRNRLFMAQTPQAFDLDTIYNAYEDYPKVERFNYTDDCSMLNNIYPDLEISLIPGNHENLKITFSEDLETFRQLLQK